MHALWNADLLPPVGAESFTSGKSLSSTRTFCAYACMPVSVCIPFSSPACYSIQPGALRAKRMHRETKCVFASQQIVSLLAMLWERLRGTVLRWLGRLWWREVLSGCCLTILSFCWSPSLSVLFLSPSPLLPRRKRLVRWIEFAKHC